jgi:GNAT superfamily N-acetyltransferase
LFKQTTRHHPALKLFLKRVHARYGDFSKGSAPETVWTWKEGHSFSAAFSLFKREWESGILGEPRWGLKWAAGHTPEDLARGVNELPILFRRIKAVSVAVRVRMDCHVFVQTLEKAGFRYVGGVVTLNMKPSGGYGGKISNGTGINVRPAKQSDLLPLKEIAQGAFREGRFYHETGLRKGSAQKIYGAWAKNMLNYAGEVVVAAGKQILGFVSLKKDPVLRRWWIDLIAVDLGSQSQGIGSRLAAESRRTAFRQKGWDLAVKTEPENLGALCFYLKNGFKPESFHLDYVWRSKSS